MAVAIVLSSGVARAEDAPAPAPATEQACESACKRLIDRCTAVFGPGMGDMRPFCTRAVMRRCRANGVQVCDAVAREGS